LEYVKVCEQVAPEQLAAASADTEGMNEIIPTASSNEVSIDSRRDCFIEVISLFSC
jgi:hypothetical protein